MSRASGSLGNFSHTLNLPGCSTAGVSVILVIAGEGNVRKSSVAVHDARGAQRHCMTEPGDKTSDTR